MLDKHLRQIIKAHQLKIYTIVAVGLVGVASLVISRAANLNTALEPELGALSGCAKSVGSTSASGGSVIQFGCTGSGAFGAQLPIQYNLASLTGTIRYVAPNGDDSKDGSINTPYATLSKAISSVSAGSTIVMRGGTYRGIVNTYVSKAVNIIAYPGEIPEMRGSIAVSSMGTSGSDWNTDGNYRWRSYNPRPVTDGSGITFSSSMENLTGDGEGRYPDQVWTGNTSLKQVVSKDKLADGKFWVDRAAGRIYLMAGDASKPNIEMSRPAPAGSTNDRDRVLDIGGQNVKIEGLRITRYSNSANDYGVITVEANAHNTTLRNIEVSDSSYISILATNSDSVLAENITIDRSNWMGFAADFTNNLTLKAVKITNMNYADEFTGSPQSGALKTGKTKGTKVLDSYIANNHSHGLWYDESNTDVLIANSVIVDNQQSGVFFEISDRMLLINSYIRSSGSREPLTIAGSSGVQLVNNTIIGGANPVGVYTDSRSMYPCSISTFPTSACGGGKSGVYDGNRLSERNPNPPPEFLDRADKARHSRSGFYREQTMDWMPRIDLMINNIVAYPTANRFCGIVPMCITTTHTATGASAPLQTILHKANSPWSGIPQTKMDGNVYATNNSNGWIIRVQGDSSTNYTNLGTFSSAMSASPVSLSGIETNGLQGTEYINTNGTPTANLQSRHGNAVPVPQNSLINQYIPAGNRHYGALFDVGSY